MVIESSVQFVPSFPAKLTHDASAGVQLAVGPVVQDGPERASGFNPQPRPGSERGALAAGRVTPGLT